MYLDTNALIYAFEGDPATQPPSVAALMGAVSRNDVAAYASLLVRAEVLVLSLKTGNQPQIVFYRRLLDESGPIRMAALTPAVADAAAALRAEHPSLKLVDALHLAAAIAAGCQSFISGDVRLRTAAKNRIALLSYDELVVQP
ncbi:MAG: PIN domain-containing protein [Porticoccaceae bacterium]